MSTFSSFTGDGGDSLGFKRRSAAAKATEASVAGAPAIVSGGNRNIRRGWKLPRATRDWSSLPKPVIHLILMGMRPAVGDAFSIAGVCKAWRSVFADCKRELFSSLPPLLVDCGFSAGVLVSFYGLVEQRFFGRKQPIPGGEMSHMSDPYDWSVIGVSHGYWIITPRRHSGRRWPVFLLDPLFPESCIGLPSAPHLRREQFNHARMTAPPTSPDCVVVATERDCIWYCRLGDREWVGHDFANGSWTDFFRFPHVAVLGRKLYVLVSRRKLVVMELLFPQPKVVVVDVEGLPLDYSAFDQLVESDGEILYIADEHGHTSELIGCCLGPDGFPVCPHKYIVRRLDLPAQRWVVLDTLGKRSIFLPGSSRHFRWKHWRATPVTCIGATEWGGKEDCIYSVCTASKSLSLWSMKEGSVEHHPLPEGRCFCEWFVPSICST